MEDSTGTLDFFRRVRRFVEDTRRNLGTAGYDALQDMAVRVEAALRHTVQVTASLDTAGEGEGLVRALQQLRSDLEAKQQSLEEHPFQLELGLYGGRGRVKFVIPKEQLEFLLDIHCTVQDMAAGLLRNTRPLYDPTTIDEQYYGVDWEGPVPESDLGDEVNVQDVPQILSSPNYEQLTSTFNALEDDGNYGITLYHSVSQFVADHI